MRSAAEGRVLLSDILLAVLAALSLNTYVHLQRHTLLRLGLLGVGVITVKLNLIQSLRGLCARQCKGLPCTCCATGCTKQSTDFAP